MKNTNYNCDYICKTAGNLDEGAHNSNLISCELIKSEIKSTDS